jgi:SAM-dependent methyltransferase
VNPVATFHGRFIHRRRVGRLAEWFDRLLPPRASVLDVGTGDGRLAARLRERRPDLELRGVEVAPREGCAIPVDAFDGLKLPFAADAFDVVLFADVLHHAEDPRRLLAEAVRVSRRQLLIKDHLREGLLANATLKFMDNVGNRRFGVPVRADYWNRSQWEEAFRQLNLSVERRETRPGLYPWWLNWWFGRSLHFIALLEKRSEPANS